LRDGLTLPDEIARRRERLDKLKIARAVIEARTRERAAAERSPAAQRSIQLH
jgi:hypothetical protein